MSEIKVVPYIPDEDYDNPAMVVDFYEFTMANCLFLNGFKDTTLVFDMFFRKNPDNQGYSISAGQRKLTRFLLNYHFNAQDIWWLRTKGMSEEFCEYLRTYKWKSLSGTRKTNPSSAQETFSASSPFITPLPTAI